MNEEVQPLTSSPGVFCNLLDEARVTSGTDILLKASKITIRIRIQKNRIVDLNTVNKQTDSCGSVRTHIFA